MHRNPYHADRIYPVPSRPAAPGRHLMAPPAGARPVPSPAAVTGRPALASLAMGLAAASLLLIVPAPAAAVTGWLAMRGRGGPGSDSYRMARAGCVIGLAVTLIAAVVLAVTRLPQLLGL